MARLYILGLTCVRTTAEARDECYLTAHVDNRSLGTIWGPREMNDGDSVKIELPPYDFDSWIQIDLREHDKIGKDEFIDYFRYRVGEPYPERYRRYPNAGEVKYALKGDRAHYELIYDLRDAGASDPGSDLERCRLILRSLRCNDAQEGKDEPYLVVNGEKVWSAKNVKSGQTLNLGDIEVAFGSYAQIDLWESDGARSDRFGEFTVDFADFERGELSRDLQHTFRADQGIVGDASYTLTYRVRRLR